MEDINLYRDIIVVYCPRKVGSTTLVTSLRLCCSNKFMIFHTHDDTIFKFADKNNKDLTISDILKNSNIIGNNLLRTKRKIYLIDIYRSPIEQKISEFFEDLSIVHYNNLEDNIAQYDINKIIKRFNDIFLHIGNEDYFSTRYNLKKQNDMIDEFDFEKKYIKIVNSDITYIKLRLLDIKNWGIILSEILGTEIIIISDYETKNKKLGLLYEQFNKIYKLPLNYYNNINDCNFLKYYYTKTERIEYLVKWKKKITENYSGFNIEQYNFYKMISNENKFFNRNLYDHYIDDGCLCKECNDKRLIIFQSLKNGNNKHIEKIYHNKTKEIKRNIYVNIYNFNKIDGFIINL